MCLDSEEEISKYGSHVARCLFLSQDRTDMTFAVNELCQRMSDSLQLFQIEATCSVSEGRESGSKFLEFGDMSSEVTVFSDSDWAGRGSRQVRGAHSWDDTI